MAQQFRSRPSDVAGIEDAYARYCFDEAVYFYGNFVEGELRKVSEKAKTNEEAQRKRMNRLAQLLGEGEAPMTPDAEQKPRSVPHNVATLDRDDPVSPETAARMPPATKFHGRQFRDPAELFKGGTTTKTTT